ncbi:transmembrane protein 171 isoform X2 [Bufo bufo]|uniref:transmembrane protein 171 isoform X2 n=1 Tax=Bufo bufo TaxID=8384 RepID=UPI001ABE931C|nr:transmembrane protein 171 isoform X2 [Bufo bufo]
METSHCLRHWKNSYVIISRLIFFMYVLGGTLFCAGFLLSLYVFQACKVGVQNYCSTSFKITGPSLAVLGLASIVLAKSKARLEATRRPLPDGQVDPDRFFLFGESRQFFQCLIFGVLIVTCGILVSILGSWIPGCKETFPDQNVTGTSSHTRTCGLLSMQILGPLIILIGLGSFVMGHIKRKRQNHEEPVIDEEPQAPADGRFHVTVGHIRMMEATSQAKIVRYTQFRYPVTPMKVIPMCILNRTLHQNMKRKILHYLNPLHHPPLLQGTHLILILQSRHLILYQKTPRTKL